MQMGAIDVGSDLHQSLTAPHPLIIDTRVVQQLLVVLSTEQGGFRFQLLWRKSREPTGNVPRAERANKAVLRMKKRGVMPASAGSHCGLSCQYQDHLNRQCRSRIRSASACLFREHSSKVTVRLPSVAAANQYLGNKQKNRLHERLQQFLRAKPHSARRGLSAPSMYLGLRRASR